VGMVDLRQSRSLVRRAFSARSRCIS
jgi:hypothetical protein